MKLLDKVIRHFRDKGSNRADPVPNMECSEFEINNWEMSDFVIKKLLPVVGIHPFPLNELLLMSGSVCRLQPTVIYEWGTNIGKSARVFYETARFFDIDVSIHSIDLPDDITHAEHPGSNRGKLVHGCNGVFLHQGDGLEWSISHFKKHPTEQPPLFFVDGDHGYESVCRELEGIIENIPKANILLHDTFFQSEASGYNIGPYQAVTDILSKHDLQHKVLSTQTGLPGMTLIYQ